MIVERGEHLQRHLLHPSRSGISEYQAWVQRVPQSVWLGLKDLLVVCQVKGFWKSLETSIVRVDGTDKEPKRLCSIACPPLLAGFFVIYAG